MKVLILSRDSHRDIQREYVDFLVSSGIPAEDIIISTVPVVKNTIPRDILTKVQNTLSGYINNAGITHLIVADTAWFKAFTKVRTVKHSYAALTDTMFGIPAVLVYSSYLHFQNPMWVNKTRMALTCIAGASPTQAVQATKGDLRINPSTQEIQALLEGIKAFPALAVDVETVGLKLSEGRILSIALAAESGDGVGVYLQSSNDPAVKEVFRNFFRSYKGKLVFHRATFDAGRIIQWLFMRSSVDYEGMLEGADIIFRDFEDTHILSYLSLNNANQNELDLKSLSISKMGNYSAGINITNTLSVAPETLVEYNYKDVLATWEVHKAYRQVVLNEQEPVYQTVFKPALKTITVTELVGMPINMGRVLKATKEVDTAVNHNLNRIRSNSHVEDLVKILRVDKAISATAKLKKKVKTADDFNDLEFNPGSTQQLARLLYEELGFPVLSRTDTGNPSVDKDTIDKLISSLQYQIRELKSQQSS